MKSLFNQKFERKNRLTPMGILKEQCTKLNEITEGTIIARVIEYEGVVYSREGTLVPLIGKDFLNVNGVDIQNSLGDIGAKFKYEFFISSTNTSNYKYRAFFLVYGLSMYPLDVILDMDIAQEIQEQRSIEDSEVFVCQDEEEYVNLLSEILNSEKITNVINSLL